MKKVSAIFKSLKLIIYLYLLYRIINILILFIADSLTAAPVSTPQTITEYRYCVNFEYPAPNINEVIDYEVLGWCHRCVIDENEFMNYENYNTIITKLNISFILLPWTVPINPFSPDNDCYRHQYNADYDISVWCGKNAFTGKTEEFFFYYNDTILLLPVLFLILICGIFTDIRKLFLNARQKPNETISLSYKI